MTKARINSICLHIRSKLALLGVMVLLGSSTLAFDELNEAQSLIYDNSHLSNTTEGQELKYAYTAVNSEQGDIVDSASVSIVAAGSDDKRDISIDFLSGERHLPLPDFSGYRGNPVIIAMLEHIAQSMSAETGGGALYFRNRIRDALAGEDVSLIEQSFSYSGDVYESVTLTFYPFVNDPYLAENTLLKQARFSIQLSETIPGGVVGVEASSRTDEGIFERRLSLM